MRGHDGRVWLSLPSLFRVKGKWRLGRIAGVCGRGTRVAMIQRHEREDEVRLMSPVSRGACSKNKWPAAASLTELIPKGVKTP